MKWHKNESNHIYWFICAFNIDDNLNFTIDTSEYDKFKLALDQHISNYTIDKHVDRMAHLIVEVTIPSQCIVQEFEYETLTLMLQSKRGK